MTRLKTLNPEEATGKTKELFTGIKSKMGVVPAMLKVMGNSPALLEGTLQLNAALGSGKIDPVTVELIALTVASVNDCKYCIAAHSFVGSRVLKIDDVTLSAAKEGHSQDPKTNAVLGFTKKLLDRKGAVTDEDVIEIKQAGISEEELAEVIGHVGFNILTNYFNKVAGTVIDVPQV